MHPLRIAQIAPLWFPVPPKLYGGIERVVSLLTEELVRRGHEVTLFAAPGSQTEACPVHVVDTPLIEAGVDWSNPLWNLQNIAVAFQMARQGRFDLIHSHLDVYTLFFQSLVDIPVLQTMHGNIQIAEENSVFNGDRYRLFFQARERSPMAFVSEASRRNSAVPFAQSWVVHNAVDIDHFRFSPAGGTYMAWVARIDPEKGLENAIAAAERSGCELRFAGRIDAHQQQYFDQRIRPHLTDRIRYMGELSHAELPAFYGAARAFLFPIEWEEPFGLVVAEAMACGTPVIAYRRGSMPELILDGETGFVVDPSIDAMIDAMGKIDQLDRAKVRAHAEKLFHPSVMTDAYERVYAEVMQAKRKS